MKVRIKLPPPPENMLWGLFSWRACFWGFFQGFFRELVTPQIHLPKSQRCRGVFNVKLCHCDPTRCDLWGKHGSWIDYRRSANLEFKATCTVTELQDHFDIEYIIDKYGSYQTRCVVFLIVGWGETSFVLINFTCILYDLPWTKLPQLR